MSATPIMTKLPTLMDMDQPPLGTIIASLKERAATLLKQLEGYKAIESELRLVSRALKVLMDEPLGRPTERKPGAKRGKPPKVVKVKGQRGASLNAIELILQAHPKGITIKELQAELADKANLKLATASIYGTMRKNKNIKQTKRGIVGVYSLK